MSLPISWNWVQFWVTMVTMILVLTNELISQDIGINRLYLNRKRLRNITVFFIVLFAVVFALTVYISFMR